MEGGGIIRWIRILWCEGGKVMEYVGTRWYKCDFHLHTMQSQCYKDKSDTVQAWIQAVKEKGLNCVAVTDHNDYRMINDIIAAGKEQNIIVFPGVEITCDTSKIHILILFDVTKNEDKVRDFLSAVDIDSECVGNTDGTVVGIFEVCKKAKSKGAIVIAAHIDEFNGINSMSPANIKKILNREYIDAVQVVNTSIWEGYSNNKDKDAMLEALKNKYEKEISINEAENWRKTYNKALESKIPLLCFSDNPCELGDAQHGLWGIGNEFTWIKMDENPNVEGLRQALLSDDMRVVSSDKSFECPEKIPDYWIKSLELESSAINPYKKLMVNFNPQLNTVIGGRGSGKSTIIRVLSGALNFNDKIEIKSIEEEQKNFYKKIDSKTGLGIFTPKSQIRVCMYRNKIEYHMTIDDIRTMDSQRIHLYKVENGVEEEILDDNFIDFFKLQVYTQKQIFEIAKDPKALLKIIDSGIEKMPNSEIAKNNAYENVLAILSQIRTFEKSVAEEGRVKAEITDIEEQIDIFKKSGISSILEKKQAILKDEKVVKDYLKNVTEIKNSIDVELAKDLSADNFDVIDNSPLKKITKEKHELIQKQLTCINDSLREIENQTQQLEKELSEGAWINVKKENEKLYQETCDTLLQKGLDITKLDQLLCRLEEKKKEVERIEYQKRLLVDKKKEYKEATEEYKKAIETIRKMRKAFIDSILSSDDNVRININPNKNRNSFEITVKDLLQKDNSTIAGDLDEICVEVFGKGGIGFFRKTIADIRNGLEEKKYSSNFRKAVKNMDDKLYDKLISYELEDEIEVMYKPEGARKYMPLSAASAGQKTTAILTFVLAYGEKPLLLDQPEDDLDNRLVYDLVVKRLKKAKTNRQLIIVTHNANIPVNGDAEYITSMDSDKRYVEIKNEGTLDNEAVRKEICDVMEGTEHAFEMRAKKYHLRIIE